MQSQWDNGIFNVFYDLRGKELPYCSTVTNERRYEASFVYHTRSWVISIEIDEGGKHILDISCDGHVHAYREEDAERAIFQLLSFEDTLKDERRNMRVILGGPGRYWFDQPAGLDEESRIFIRGIKNGARRSQFVQNLAGNGCLTVTGVAGAPGGRVVKGAYIHVDSDHATDDEAEMGEIAPAAAGSSH